MNRAKIVTRAWIVCWYLPCLVATVFLGALHGIAESLDDFKWTVKNTWDGR